MKVLYTIILEKKTGNVYHIWSKRVLGSRRTIVTSTTTAMRKTTVSQLVIFFFLSLLGLVYTQNLGYPVNNGYYGQGGSCPLCDSSVCTYCGEKLLHDACCCLPIEQLPPQCRYADCSFLHAKSCYEHSLITRCCCAYLLRKSYPFLARAYIA